MSYRVNPAAVLLALALANVFASVAAFHIPGISPTEYKENDPIDLWFNKVYSDKAQLPFEYLRLPVCNPEGQKVIRENIGEILRGDRIIKSGVQFKFDQSMPCTTMCEPVTATKEKTKWVRKLIEQDYKVEWYLDGLPAATPYRTTTSQKKLYEPGFKLGYVTENGEVALNNHFAIVVLYHVDPEEYEGARIVGFEVYPQSISSQDRKECMAVKSGTTPPPHLLPADEETTIVYTYSIEFKEDKELTWALRWDLYLSNSDPNIHWYSIINSLMILLFLSGMVGVIILRTLYNDISIYNEEDAKEDQEEVTGWKLVHGDVFRPPTYGWFLAVLFGSGVQFLSMIVAIVGFATVGLLNPSYRGGFGSFVVFLYVFMGAFSGYWSARLYKTFKGVNWQKNALMAATFLPGVLFGVLFFLNFFIWGAQSSSALPFGTFVALVALWFGVSTPLVLIGAYFGQKKKAIEHPVRTNQIPRQIPEINWFLKPWVSVLVGGVVPFAVIFIELFFIMKSIWQDQFYYMFGFLATVLVFLGITCIEITLILIYFSLCAEDYHWWWRSFFISSGSTFYIFGYAIYYYFTRLHINSFIPALVYFGHVSMACLVYMICTGTLGFAFCYFALMKIYGAVKVD